MKFGLPLKSRYKSRCFSARAASLALTILCGLGVCGLSVMGAAPPAHAGFDWTPRANHAAPAPDTADTAPQDAATDGSENGGIAVLPPITAAPPVMDASAMPSVSPAPLAAAPAHASLTKDGPLTPDPDDDMAAMPLPAPSAASSSAPHWGKETNYFARKDQQLRPEPLDAPADSATIAQNDTTPLVLSNRPELSDAQGYVGGSVGGSVGRSVAPMPSDTATEPSMIQPMADTLIPPGQAIPGDQAVLDGFGNDIPLALALRDIVPTRYAFAYANSSYAGLTVSWEGGKPWQDVLNDTLASKGLGASITRNIIYIQPYASSLGTAPLSPEPKTKYEQAAPLPTPLDTDMGNANVLKSNFKTVWTAKPGYTLREVIENWARVANVQVEWTNPYDYPINDTYSYDGTFARAVAGLITQYNGENPRPVGRLYPNLPKGPSVLVIK